MTADSIMRVPLPPIVMRQFARFALTIMFATAIHAAEPSPWPAHDTSRAQPTIVTPAALAGAPPSDAIVLFDGTDMSHWEATDATPSKWKLEDGCMMPTAESGALRTKQSFGDVQLHAEWSSPTPPKGSGQGRGNSGIYFMTKYEVQVLDSYENETYPDGQAASMYGQNPPLVNACLPPGAWQTYDIIFRRPRFNDDNTLNSPAIMTVIHNGVVVQDHFELWGPTNWLQHDKYARHPDQLPIRLQDHGNPVRYRNIWLRELPARSPYTSLGKTAAKINLTSDELDKFIGNYDDLEIKNDNGGLRLKFLARWFDLVPQSPTSFRFLQTNAGVDFQLDQGTVTGLDFDLMGDVSHKARTNN